MKRLKKFLDQRGKRFWWILRIVVVILIVIAIFALGLFGGEDYVTNLYTELIGVTLSIGVTVAIVDQLYEHRDRENLKWRLVQEAGSHAHAIAIPAIDRLRKEGWLTGDNGLLKGVDLSGANLENAKLSGANLRWTNLKEANLRNAKLIGTDLRDTDLRFADLKNADLSQAKLNSAKLFGANLQEAKLFGANLLVADLQNADLRKAEMQATNLGEMQQRGTNMPKDIPSPAKLRYAKLQGAYLKGAILPSQRYQGTIPPHESYLYCAVLPDGEKYTPTTDMKKYTDPQHHEFQETHDKIKNIRQGNRIIATSEAYVIRDENE